MRACAGHEITTRTTLAARRPRTAVARRGQHRADATAPAPRGIDVIDSRNVDRDAPPAPGSGHGHGPRHQIMLADGPLRSPGLGPGRRRPAGPHRPGPGRWTCTGRDPHGPRAHARGVRSCAGLAPVCSVRAWPGAGELDRCVVWGVRGRGPAGPGAWGTALPVVEGTGAGCGRGPRAVRVLGSWWPGVWAGARPVAGHGPVPCLVLRWWSCRCGPGWCRSVCARRWAPQGRPARVGAQGSVPALRDAALGRGSLTALSRLDRGPPWQWP